MNTDDIYAYFTSPKRKIGIIIRFFACILSIGFLAVFAASLNAVFTRPALDLALFRNLVAAAFFFAAFWPVSYVAIKGFAPKTWHPYA